MPVELTDWIIQPSLTASPARLRVSRVRTALWSVAHAAMRPYRDVALWVPVCPSREHGGSRPRLRSSLWSVLRCKTIPPLHPPACPAPPLACSRRANLASKHTHMSMEAYPPDGHRISPPQGSQNFSARVVRVGKSASRVKARLLSASCFENFCAQQAGGCAVPDPNRFGEPEIRPCPHTHVVGSNSNIWR
jgi:hypothetical protein